MTRSPPHTAARLYMHPSYTYSEEHANSEYVCPLKLVSGSYNEQQKSFVEFFKRNSVDKNITVIENTEDGKALPLELIGAYRSDGVTVQEALLACDESDLNYRGLSLRTVMADGILSYYYVYIPEAVRNSTEKVPVVLAMSRKSARYTDYVYSSG